LGQSRTAWASHSGTAGTTCNPAPPRPGECAQLTAPARATKRASGAHVCTGKGENCASRCQRRPRIHRVTVQALHCGACSETAAKGLGRNGARARHMSCRPGAAARQSNTRAPALLPRPCSRAGAGLCRALPAVRTLRARRPHLPSRGPFAAAQLLQHALWAPLMRPSAPSPTT